MSEHAWVIRHALIAERIRTQDEVERLTNAGVIDEADGQRAIRKRARLKDALDWFRATDDGGR